MSGLHALLHRRAPPAGRAGAREAVVLSGGGSLGAAQVGALRALFEAGRRGPTCSSAARSARSTRPSSPSTRRSRGVDELERVWRSLDRKDVFGARPPASPRQVLQVAVRGEDHLYEPARAARRWSASGCRSRTSRDTAVPVPRRHDRPAHRASPAGGAAGDPVAVLTASACLPAVFPPVALGGSAARRRRRHLPVPVERALELGAARTWVARRQRRLARPARRADERARRPAAVVRHQPLAPVTAAAGRPPGPARRPAAARLDVGPDELRGLLPAPPRLHAGRLRRGAAAVAAEAAEQVPRPRRVG